jgi:ribosomal protein L40E
MTSPTVAPAPPSASPLGPVHTHACARCGAPVPLDVGLCERCNPLGLRDSASSQVHGTVLVAVIVAIVGLALAAKFAVAGIGPFSAVVAGMTEAGDGLVVQLQVTNNGSSAGTTTCRISDPANAGAGKVAFVLSPRVPPKGTVTFEAAVATISGPPRPLDVVCSAP